MVSLRPLVAQDMPSPTRINPVAPTAITENARRLLELGQLYMGRNNPAYACTPEELTAQQRNDAAQPALSTLQQLTTLYPKYADGWLWLGIALTETLCYSKQSPKGAPSSTPATITEGVRAFRTAYECNPTDLVCVTYYGDALMQYRADFDAARQLWENYFKIAKTDMQKVTALTQAARACLNKAYFGKIEKRLSPEQVKQEFQAAERFVQQAAAICPQAPHVTAMQGLLKQYRTTLYGK
jgi:hypothetical protein